MAAARRLATFAAFLLGFAGVGAWSRLGAWSRPPRSHARARVVPRAQAKLADADGGDELSKELSSLVFKMPRLVDPQRAAYEAFRERRLKQDRGEREATSSEVVDLDNPSGETPQWREPGEAAPKRTPIDFEIEINAFDEEEEAYVVDDIDAEDTDATANYLDKL